VTTTHPLPGRQLADLPPTWRHPDEYLIGRWWLEVAGGPECGRGAWCRWRPADRHGAPGRRGGFETRAEAEAYGRAYLYTLARASSGAAEETR
jgi:hypothetical protein